MTGHSLEDEAQEIRHDRTHNHLTPFLSCGFAQDSLHSSLRHLEAGAREEKSGGGGEVEWIYHHPIHRVLSGRHMKRSQKAAMVLTVGQEDRYALRRVCEKGMEEIPKRGKFGLGNGGRLLRSRPGLLLPFPEGTSSDKEELFELIEGDKQPFIVIKLPSRATQGVERRKFGIIGRLLFPQCQQCFFQRGKWIVVAANREDDGLRPGFLRSKAWLEICANKRGLPGT